MDILFWVLIGASIVIAFLGLIYPVIPSVVFLVLAYILYGVFFTFQSFNWVFWTIQILFLLLIFIADQLTNAVSVKKYGGSKAGIWGSTIGLIIGPFVFPFLGILIGPFLGAVIAELLFSKRTFKEACVIGFGSVVGFIGSVIVKFIIMLIMVIYFFIVVL